MNTNWRSHKDSNRIITEEGRMHGIPVLTAQGKGIAEAWENSLIVLNDHGCQIKTMYDKPEDPPSRDATMIITIEEPLSEPMIHKDFPGGLEDL